MRVNFFTYLAICFSVLAPVVQAKGLYLTEAEFLNQAFSGGPACTKTLWLTGETKTQLQALLERRAVGLRQRYGQTGNRTAWIFNEVGKELPITFGVVVVDNRVQQLAVLEYRESRGGEIRHPFFTKQFDGLALTESYRLSETINGITGATLSVRSAERVVKAALYLHDQVMQSQSRMDKEACR